MFLALPVRHAGPARECALAWIRHACPLAVAAPSSLALGEFLIHLAHELLAENHVERMYSRAAAEREFHVFGTQGRRNGSLATHVSVAIHLT